MSTKYTAEAISTGSGRNGHTRTKDGVVDFALAFPVELGGSGDGANPEQLFAAGYAACYHSALQGAARAAKVELGDSSVGARVSLVKGDDGFGLEVELEVIIPGMANDEAQKLADQAHQNCPYSKATRGNIPVKVTVADD